MRNLFKFSSVLTTRACVNKYGVPQIGKVTIPDPDIRYSIADKQFKMSLRIQIAALLQQRDQRSAASPPLKSVMLPTNRSMSPSSAYVTSYIADKSLRAATSRWGQETMFYIADNTKQIKSSPRGEGFHIFYCRQTDRDQLWIWETQLFSLGNSRFSAGPAERTLSKCRHCQGSCAQTDENAGAASR